MQDLATYYVFTVYHASLDRERHFNVDQADAGLLDASSTDRWLFKTLARPSQ